MPRGKDAQRRQPPPLRCPGRTLQEDFRDSPGVVRFAFGVKFWPPSVEQARPAKCALCGVAAYDGLRVVLHGHGLVSRQQRGPASAGEEASCAEIWIRRYLCTACDTVMRVVPASATARKHFSGAAIGLALALWGLCGKSAREVREAVNDRKVIGFGACGWTTLGGWAKQVAAGRLFAWLGLTGTAGSPRAVAARAAQALVGWAAVEAREASPEAAAFTGASHVS